jgi:hypothetical protein
MRHVLVLPERNRFRFGTVVECGSAAKALSSTRSFPFFESRLPDLSQTDEQTKTCILFHTATALPLLYSNNQSPPPPPPTSCLTLPPATPLIVRQNGYRTPRRRYSEASASRSRWRSRHGRRTSSRSHSPTPSTLGAWRHSHRT